MRDAHRRFKFQDKHFEKFVEYMMWAFKELKIDEKIIKDISIKIESLRKDTLNK